METKDSAKTAGRRASRSSTGSVSKRSSRRVSDTSSAPDGQQDDAADQGGPAAPKRVSSDASASQGTDSRVDHPADPKAATSRRESVKPEGAVKNAGLEKRRKPTSSRRSASSRKSSSRSSRSSSQSTQLANDGGAAEKTAASHSAMRKQRRERKSRKQSKMLDDAPAFESDKAAERGASQPSTVPGSGAPSALMTGLQMTNLCSEFSATREPGTADGCAASTYVNPTPLLSTVPAGATEEPTAMKASMTQVSPFEIIKSPRDPYSFLGISMPEYQPRSKNSHSANVRCRMAVIVLFLLASVLLPLLVVTWLYLFANQDAPSSFAVCSTDGCLNHAAALSAKRNRSLDPCEDFGLYVCAAWKRKHSTLASTKVEEVVLDSILEQSRPKMSEYHGDVPLGQRPEQFMALCEAARPSDDVSAVRAFKEFVQGELGFLDPPQKPPGDGRLPANSSLHAQLLKALVVLSGRVSFVVGSLRQ